jgi:PPM family protein phosphatase
MRQPRSPDFVGLKRAAPMTLKGKFAHVEVTHVGKVRDHNEDAIGSQPEIGLWVLADGMGGYNAGEVASGIAVKTVIELVTQACKRPEKRNEVEPGTGYMRQTIALRDAVHRANKIINQTAQTQPQCEGMGTTLVASLFYDDRVSIAHVGDSRMYRMRGNRFEQVTMDHSLLQELVDRGFYSQEEAQRSTNRNYVTRALGVEANVEVEVQELDVQKGDYFLMCSDGLPDMVEDEDIHLTISTFNNDVKTIGEQLIKLTNDNGGRDNVSVVLVRVTDSFPADAGLLGKFRSLFG